MAELKKECKHLNAIARGIDSFGWLYCPDCDKCVRLVSVINALLERMRDAANGVAIK